MCVPYTFQVQIHGISQRAEHNDLDGVHLIVSRSQYRRICLTSEAYGSVNVTPLLDHKLLWYENRDIVK